MSTYTIAGKQLACAHCGGNRFTKSERIMESRALEFFDLGWMAQGVTLFACTSCGRVELFTNPAYGAGVTKVGIDCKRCGTWISAESAKCPNCGSIKVLEGDRT